MSIVQMSVVQTSVGQVSVVQTSIVQTSVVQTSEVQMLVVKTSVSPNVRSQEDSSQDVKGFKTRMAQCNPAILFTQLPQDLPRST